MDKRCALLTNLWINWYLLNNWIDKCMHRRPSKFVAWQKKIKSADVLFYYFYCLGIIELTIAMIKQSWPHLWFSCSCFVCFFRNVCKVLAPGWGIKNRAKCSQTCFTSEVSGQYIQTYPEKWSVRHFWALLDNKNLKELQTHTSLCTSQATGFFFLSFFFYLCLSQFYLWKKSVRIGSLAELAG